MIFGQVLDRSYNFSGKAGYIQVGIAELGIPQVLERIENINDFGILFYGEYESTEPNRIMVDGVLQSDIMYLLNETTKPVHGVVLHPPTRDLNYYEFIWLMKNLNQDTHGFVAIENRCRTVRGLPLYYVTTPFDVVYYLDARVPLFLDVMALFVACKYSNNLLIKTIKSLNADMIKGYHLINLMMTDARNCIFKTTRSLKFGMIDYKRVIAEIKENKDALVTIEARGKENFERNVEWLECQVL